MEDSVVATNPGTRDPHQTGLSANQGPFQPSAVQKWFQRPASGLSTVVAPLEAMG